MEETLSAAKSAKLGGLAFGREMAYFAVFLPCVESSPPNFRPPRAGAVRASGKRGSPKSAECSRGQRLHKRGAVLSLFVTVHRMLEIGHSWTSLAIFVCRSPYRGDWFMLLVTGQGEDLVLT